MPKQVTSRRKGGGTSLRDKDGFYTVPAEGAMVRVRSVTSILRNGLPKPALMRWHAEVVADETLRLMAEIDRAADRLAAARKLLDETKDPTATQALLDEVASARIQRQEATRYLINREWLAKTPDRARDAGGDRGSALHKLAEHHSYGEAFDESTIDPIVRPYWESLRRSIDAWCLEYLMAEGCVFSLSGNYAGTCDGVVRIAFDRPETIAIAEALHRVTGFNGGQSCKLLIDYKSSKRTFYDHSLQMAAYRHCEWVYYGNSFPRDPMPQVDAGAVILASPTGCAMHLWPCGEQEYETFLAVKRVAESVLAAPEPEIVQGASL